MDLEKIPTPTKATLDQLAGVTGVGWTTSVLGFLTALIGYGNHILARFLVEPQALLYAGVVFFVATLGLDKLANSIAEDEAMPAESSD
ncbi:hypothetical protein [Haloarcula marina]|uniref:hypothetical protein n=1 Tax=Haloarcula marina TaxID=2961574 RepID=UPI0020B6D484|nr:hypothetical protein [Halomicroarcula marina]